VALAMPPDALALQVQAPLVIDGTTGAVDFDETANLGNNCANVTGTVAIANGGTGQTGATAAFNALDPLTTKGDIVTHNGTNSVRLAVGSDGDVLTADSAQTNGIKWATPSTGVFGVIDFLSETKIPSGSGTFYIGIGGRVSNAEADVRSSIDAASLKNLRCYSSAATGGTGVTVTLGIGACTSTLTYTSTPAVTVTSTTAVAETSTTAQPTAGQCAALKAVAASTTTPTFINCNLAKTANS
jgi:hypothetical protein